MEIITLEALAMMYGKSEKEMEKILVKIGLMDKNGKSTQKGLDMNFKFIRPENSDLKSEI